MRILHSPNSSAHQPERYFRRGAIVPHPEQAVRYRRLRDVVLADGHDLMHAGEFGLGPIKAVHATDYVEFLATAWARREAVPGIDDEIGSSHFARPHMSRRPEGILGQIGYYMADTSTPIQAGTWDAIYGSAQAAVSAAELLASGEIGAAYALCRPPGHHAYANSAGGFCFLNNTAIAARHLVKRSGGRIAIIDIDVHHGNGTQGIFYETADVLTLSVHADPANYFPFYTGYADESGVGAGLDHNHNFPLAEGADDQTWHKTLADMLALARSYQPVAVVVALGFDASVDDPIGAFGVTTDGFSKAASMIAGLGLPTVLVQEGGYLCDALPLNLSVFLKSFESAHQV